MKLMDKIKAHPAVSSIDDEGLENSVFPGGTGDYWVYLKPGFTLVSNRGDHIIHEPTLRSCWAYLKDVVPCDCGECAAVAI